jgi:SAM-dependent methyltransferase
MESVKMVFKDYSNYYDALYSDKEYEAEVDFIRHLVSLESSQQILDLGCGTGRHDFLLASSGHSVTGVDLSKRMLAIARKKAAQAGTKIEFILDDIRTVRLGKAFDLVISMFAVMSYQVTNDDLFKTLQTARAHLAPGGVFVFDAWFGPAVLAQRPEERVKEITTGDERIIRIAKPELDVLHNLVTVNYTIMRFKGEQQLDETHEAHRMRYLFLPEVAWMAQSAGFEVVKTCPFMDTGRLPTEKDWNVTWVLQAV